MTLPTHLPKSTLYRAEAIVLRQRPLGEADRLVILYSKDAGKLRASARGVKRAKSRLAGHLEPLTHVSLLLVRGSSLDIVTQAQALHSFPHIRDDLRRAASGLYVAELVDLFTEAEAPHREVFDLLLDTLYLLSTVDTLNQAVRRFEARLLVLMGYSPHMETCVVCGGVIGEGAGFSAAWGGVLCSSCAPRDPDARLVSPEERRWLTALQAEAQVRVESLPREGLAGLGKLLRWYIQHILERPVRSGVFLDSLEGGHDGP